MNDGLTDEDLRRWACEWTGNYWCEGTNRPRSAPDRYAMSDAELAEAVREKFADDEVSITDNGTGVPVWSGAARDAFRVWGGAGPLAFIDAVHAIVEAKP